MRNFDKETLDVTAENSRDKTLDTKGVQSFVNEEDHFEGQWYEEDEVEDEDDDCDEMDDLEAQGTSKNSFAPNSKNGHHSLDNDDPYVYSLFAKAEKYRGLEMYDMELRFLFDVLKYAPNHPDVWIKIGRAYRVLGNHKMALDAYQKAIMINPSDPFIYGNLGALYIHMGKIESACHHLEKAVETIPEAAPGYETMLANYAMALALDNQKKKAWKYLSKAEKMGYQNGDIIRKKVNLRFWDKFFG